MSYFLISMVDTRDFLWDPSDRSTGLDAQAACILIKPGVVNTRHRTALKRTRNMANVTGRKELGLGVQPGV